MQRIRFADIRGSLEKDCRRRLLVPADERGELDTGWIQCLRHVLKLFGIDVPDPLVCTREGCGGLFYPTSGRYAKEYCSPACKTASYRE